ncbi:ABC transporter permease [Dysosmobacter acutus]|uniref:ABC transporter permease n=1 Tax=Dysosmobacter acutus TaxID=2841504 RepID=UPI0030B9D486
MEKPREEEVLRRVSFLEETWKSLRKNRMAMLGLVIIALVVLSSIFAGVIAPYGVDDQNLKEKFLSPSFQHLFGTDNYGRDIFSRILYGGRISVVIGVLSAILSAIFGALLGSLAGYYGGKTDNIVMRCVDVVMAIPSMLLSIAIVAALGNTVQNVIIAVAIGAAPSCARVVRASILSIKDQEFVEAAHSIGGSNYRIILHHILPNCMAPLIVNTTMSVANAILCAASLSFVGLGVQPPSPEWGAMLSAARPFIREHWFVVIFPGLAIMVTIFGLNLLGDGLRDALDPRLKK